MKQLIVLMATILLGIAIYGMIAGPSDHSIKNTMGGVWKQETELRKSFP